MNIKKSSVIEYTEGQIEEIIKCACDSVYFIEKYCKITNSTNSTITSSLYDYQKNYIKSLEDWGNNIEWWSRQMGKTSTTLAFIVWKLIFHSDINIAIMGISLAHTQSLMALVNHMLSGLPDWLAPVKTESLKARFRLENGSRLITITSLNNLRGISLDILFMDDFAYHKNQDLSEVLPSLISSRGKLIIVSTGKKGSTFNKLFNESLVNPLTKFKAHGISWEAIPYRTPDFKANTIAMIGQQNWDQEYEVGYA